MRHTFARRNLAPRLGNGALLIVFVDLKSSFGLGH